jgi:hypothetical protein
MLLNFPLLIIIPPFLHVLLVLPEVCSSPDQAAHYHICGRLVLKSSPDILFMLSFGNTKLIFMEVNSVESDASQQ